ncbi:Na(+)/H(+) antiporter subunit D [Methanocalculus taiwanensis]|uniref:Na(+)/H(+) antiporter subunit D n=1 Tax=Methanocalculus taiwanensis TaxID=106207 RepID=A0ABD4TKH2_9EURY|nr:Na(+)/H(+) antiporter subunit D [Methanocalculus taiwanensis]MCQ1538315.1 Na(+)/H(+) antiporter subunit D [Methanocalculus taiwanensis]
MIALPPFLIYIIGAALLPLLPKRVRHEWMLFVTIAGLAAISLQEYGMEVPLLQLLPGIGLSLLSVDGLSRVVGYIFAGISVLAVIYSSQEERLSHQMALLVQVASGMGIVYAGDFITLFIFWELLALSSLALIWHGYEGSKGAGYRYALMHILGGVFLLAAIAVQLAETGSMQIGPAAPGTASLLFIIGIGMNAAIIPLHAWLPESYSKASIVGSVILCIFTTKAAVYLLARTLPGSEAVMYIGAIMVVYGLVFAILQDDMRMLLSYHVISQVGYMVAAVGIGTTLALNGGIAHLFNHILYKALLFMVVGAIIFQTGRHRLSELGGLGKQMPITFSASLIASAAISGVPGFNGYVSKEMIVGAAAESGLLTLELLLLIGSIGTFLSFVKLNYYAFIKEKLDLVTRDPPVPMQIAMVMTASACIIYGVYPWLLFSILPYPVTHDIFSISHILEMIIIFAAVLLNLWVVRSMIKKPTYIPPDMMALYRVAGSGVLSLSHTILPTISGRFSDFFDWCVKGASWFTKNPVMAADILVQSVLVPLSFNPASQSRRKIRLSTLIRTYPQAVPESSNAAYGIFVASAVAFTLFLTVFLI